MYTVYIVDDDPIILKGLSSTIDWEKNGYSPPICALNGKKALEMMHQKEPDVVITDASMPIMDGIELTKQIRFLYPFTKVIILSGYDEFEYVQNALSLKVTSYLLKPVKNDVLLKAVNKAIEEFSKEKDMNALVLDNLPVLRAKFLNTLLSHQPMNEAEFISKSKILHLNISPEDAPFIVMMLITDNDVNDKIAFNIDSALLSERQSMEMQNIVSSIIRRTYRCECFYHGEALICLCALSNNNPSRQSLNMLFQEVLMSCEIETKIRCTIGYSSIYPSHLMLRKAYNEVCNSLHYRHVTGLSTVYPPLSIEKNNLSISPDYKSFIRRVIDATHLYLYDESIDVLSELYKVLHTQSNITLDFAKMLLSSMLVELMQKVFVRECDFEVFLKTYHRISQALTLDEAFQSIRPLILTLCNREIKDSSSKSELISQIKSYIQEHYSDQDLSLTSISSSIGISAVYLSSLFKHETKENITEYILKVRMDKAISYILKGNCKMYEISELVGYGTPHYFSASFKKYTGFSPSDYKTKLLGETDRDTV